MTEGENYGIRNIGHYAWDSLRVQKGIAKAPNEIGLNTPSEMMKQYSTAEVSSFYQLSICIEQTWSKVERLVKESNRGKLSDGAFQC